VAGVGSTTDGYAYGSIIEHDTVTLGILQIVATTSNMGGRVYASIVECNTGTTQWSDN